MNNRADTNLLRRKWQWAVVLAACLAAGAGCKSVPSDSLSAFSSGLSAARTQSQEAFTAVNALMADASVDYAANQTHLVESSFAAGLDDDSLQAWDEVLEKLQQYAQHLQALVSPQLTQSFEDASVALSGSLKDFGQHLQQQGLVSKAPQISASLATDFTELAEVFIRFRARTRAREVLVRTDPEVARICRSLADSLGATRTNGLRGTVAAHWSQRLADQKQLFLAKPDYAGKRAAAGAFGKLLQSQNAQDLVLVSLRHSLLALADLHHALALAETWTAQSATAAIAAEIQHTRDLYSRFAKISNP